MLLELQGVAAARVPIQNLQPPNMPWAQKDAVLAQPERKVMLAAPTVTHMKQVVQTALFHQPP